MTRQQRPRGRSIILGLGVTIALVLFVPTWGVAADTTASVGVNTSVAFSGNGFNANESLSVWETGPDSNVAPLTGIQTDGNGAFTVSLAFPTDGQWQVTAHSIVTGRELIGRYAVGTSSTTNTTSTTNVVSPPSTPNTPSIPPPALGSVGALPPPVNNASSLPPSTPTVGVGSSVTFSGNGFNAGEPISVWTTAPDSTVARLDSVYADGAGGFTVTVAFSSAGVWQVTAHGRDSTHEVIGRYTVTGDAAATTAATTQSTFISPYAGVPVKATSGTVVTFTTTGFNAGENVSVWSTAPDSTVTPLDYTQASPNGRVVISTSFSSAGLWQITLHGKDSAREVIGKYQVTVPT